MYFLYIQHKCASGWINRIFEEAASYENIKMVPSESFAGDFLSSGIEYEKNDLCLVSININ